MLDRDRRSLRAFMEEEAERERLEAEERERPVREATEQLRATHRKLAAVERERLTTVPDPDRWLDPAVGPNVRMTDTQADDFNRTQSKAYRDAHPELWSAELVDLLASYFSKEKIKLVTAEMLERLVQRFADAGLLPERPAEPSWNPSSKSSLLLLLSRRSTLAYGAESLGEFLLGDSALKGLAFSDRLLHASKAAKVIEASPRLQQVVQLGINALRAGTVQGSIGLARTGDPMRAIDAGDIQRFIASCMAEGLDPKTIRNFWGTVSLIWNAALAQKFVDAVLPKPKLPRRPKKRAKFFSLSDVAKIIAASEGEDRVLYWLAAESGLRAGELAGLKLSDIEGERLTVNQSVWLGKEQTPKTNNAIRSLGLSPQLISLLWEQITRQRQRGHDYLFTASTGSPLDMNVYRRRKMTVLLKSLGISQAGYHAFRHFNVALMDALRVPLKTIQERIGHALTGSFTLDVYGGQPEWGRNLEAANLIGAELEKAVSKLENEVANTTNYGLSPFNEKGSEAEIS